MTASPLRPRSQNAETMPNRSAVSLRSLPPTLFKLRNLNSPTTAAVSSQNVSPAADSASSKGATPDVVAVTATQHRIDTPQSPAAATIRRGLISRLSSQTLVLFIILGIAITGIVVGNRGGVPEESIAVTTTEPSIDLQATATPTATPTATLASTSDSIETVLAKPLPAEDAALSIDPSDAMPSDASNHASLASASIGTSVAPDSVSNDAIPSQASLGSPTVTSNKAATETEPGETPRTGRSDADHTAVKQRSGIRRSQTRTPAGVDDWSRYLPSVEPSLAEPGTVAATSQTPESPIASYQQYLQSMSPGTSSVTAPVGYTADPSQRYGTNTVGTQASLPTSSSPTQNR